MSVSRNITTAEELYAAGDIGRCELVRGKLHMLAFAGDERGAIAMQAGLLLTNYVREHQLGRVYATGTGFITQRNPDSVLAPDVAFVRKERVRPRGSRGFFVGAPDLAVEVMSPDDVRAKADAWLAAGTRQVWVLHPRHDTVSVYRAGRDPIVLHRTDKLSGEDVVPGFEVATSEVFDLD